MNRQSATQLRTEFKSFFLDSDGYFQLPGNVGGGRTVVGSCKTILSRPTPLLFQTLSDWDGSGNLRTRSGEQVNVLSISRGLHSLGQWEGAWALGQLHYDQCIKQEARKKSRFHKGHPACGLAILAHDLGSPLMCRHFAMLSSAGDLYWEHQDVKLREGGLGPTIFERFGSHQLHQQWRTRVRSQIAKLGKNNPLYLEAFIAAGWFESHAKHIFQLAKVAGKGGKPFVEVLLDSVEQPAGATSTATGTRFEAAAGLLLATTPGFEVDSARKTADEQIDLVVRYIPDKLCDLGLESGFGLVECKSSTKPVSVSDLRDFGAKCIFHRVGFGILVTRGGVTKGLAKFSEPMNAELVRRRFQVDGLTLLVLDISHLRNKCYELRGLHDELKDDYRRLVFGHIP